MLQKRLIHLRVIGIDQRPETRIRAAHCRKLDQFGIGEIDAADGHTAAGHHHPHAAPAQRSRDRGGTEQVAGSEQVSYPNQHAHRRLSHVRRR